MAVAVDFQRGGHDPVMKRRRPQEAQNPVELSGPGRAGVRRRDAWRAQTMAGRTFAEACEALWAPGALSIHSAKSRAARVESRRFLARPRSGPRSFFPSASMRGSSIGGNRPKLTFIGWNERGPASIDSMWPPVMWLSRAPMAVVGGGAGNANPSRSAAAKRPAIRPMAALST